jgi:hypothetical protein
MAIAETVLAVYSDRGRRGLASSPRSVRDAAQWKAPSRSTTSVASQTSIDQARKRNLSGSSGWHHVTARRWSPAYGAITISIGIARDGVRRRGTGKLDEIETVRHGTHGMNCFQRRPKFKANDFEATHLT